MSGSPDFQTLRSLLAAYVAEHDDVQATMGDPVAEPPPGCWRCPCALCTPARAALALYADPNAPQSPMFVSIHRSRRNVRAGQISIYFAVPTHYTIGDTFASFQEAVEASRAKIVPLDCGGYSRQFVDVRLADATGDKMLHRVEIFSA